MYQGFLYIYIYTPKTNMEPKNGGLEDEDHPFLLMDDRSFQRLIFRFQPLVFTGCQAHSAVLWFNGGWKALLTTSWVVSGLSGAKQKSSKKDVEKA